MNEDLIEAILEKLDGDEVLLDGTEYDVERTADPFEIELSAFDADGELTGRRYRAIVSVTITEVLPVADPPAVV